MPKSNSATTAKIMEITTKVVKMLAPLGSNERQQVVQASLTLLGEPSVGSRSSEEPKSLYGDGRSGKGLSRGTSGLPASANAWAEQNGITSEQLEEVFHADGGNVSVIGNVPGKNTKAKTLNAYVLQGVVQLLASGAGNFDDKSARQLCQNQGCYNAANHAVYLGATGNILTGSKAKGWKLTAPGLKRGAELVKEMTKGA